MKKMTGSELRRTFLEFFRERGHTVVASSSLIPAGDPTLLFTNAGMVQFKDTFVGLEKRPYTRAVTAQRCLRVSGKHNDLEEVGRTARHATFFEMLGNFSFGDYFKREAITYAWELLTEALELSKDRLWITVYRDDDEAAGLWQEVAGVPADRIIRLGEKDNFWSMGDTGPCGPCSELIYDRGPEHRCDAPVCAVGECDCDRWLEVWNLVFMQFERDEEGRMTPLPRPSIDTGMGLERMASILQGVPSIFETDLVWPIIEAVQSLTGKKYDRGPDGMPFRVIADHARACAFLITDGILPGNEGRGYVLRRILRRAVRYGKVLGLSEPFLHRMVSLVIEAMGDAYPELIDRREHVVRVVRAEEEKFQETLHEGMKIAAEIVERTRRAGSEVISGEDAFRLYDTYGFPLDLTRDLAAEAGLSVDEEGFKAAMSRQRERARAARKQEGGWGELVLADDAGASPTEFLGYSELQVEAELLGFVDEAGRFRTEAEPGFVGAVVLSRTPFYAEAGGQVGDAGEMAGEGFRFAVEDTRRSRDGVVLHVGRLMEGQGRRGLTVWASVDPVRRSATARHHTATHLLHKALREVLGEHAAQAGSLVAPDRQRFDFTHFGALEPEELREVEELVNRAIFQDLPVSASHYSYQEALDRGAVALFGEKYGDKVRVVEIGDFSLELCGGTHVERTGQIGLFRITAEASIGSGLRRIEAVCGQALLDYTLAREGYLEEAGSLLRCSAEEVPEKVRSLLARVEELEASVEGLKSKLAREAGLEILENTVEIDGVRVARAVVPGADIKGLREMADFLRDKMGSGVVVLGAEIEGKASLIAAATPDVVKRGVRAGDIVREAARLVGGGGGGRPDMAQAGGKDPSGLESALERAVEVIREQLAG